MGGGFMQERIVVIPIPLKGGRVDLLRFKNFTYDPVNDVLMMIKYDYNEFNYFNPVYFSRDYLL